MNASFWQNKKVLLTGHTGFKGSWLMFWLQSMGANVVGYSLPPEGNPNLFNLIKLGANTRSYLGNVEDYDALLNVVKIEQPEIVFHLAAQSLVRQSYVNPLQTYATNVMGTVNLLEAMRIVKCTRVAVIVSSDKCYDNRDLARGYHEADQMGGYDPYSSSKGCVELISSAYRNSFFKHQDQHDFPYLATARAGNVVGGGDWAVDRLIPDFMRAVFNDENIVVRHPYAIRPWQHVLEPLSGYLLLAETLWNRGNEFTGAWNFGPNDEDAKPVEWVVNQLIENFGNRISCKLDVHDHLHEALTLKLDISKAKSHLKWMPRWTLKQALQHTAAWYQSYHEKGDVEELMSNQILDYGKTK